jgi:hypothetical protein
MTTPHAALPPPGPRRWRDAAGEHIDVRGLPPPQPLVAILRLVQQHRDGGVAVVVHHDRDPVLLYPELAELGWQAERIDAEPGELRLRLTRHA